MTPEQRDWLAKLVPPPGYDFVMLQIPRAEAAPMRREGWIDFHQHPESGISLWSITQAGRKALEDGR